MITKPRKRFVAPRTMLFASADDPLLASFDSKCMAIVYNFNVTSACSSAPLMLREA
jgi:hypothetical protein